MVIVEGGYLMIILDVTVRWYAPSGTFADVKKTIHSCGSRDKVPLRTCTYWGLDLCQKLASRVQSKESARSDVILKMPYCHKIR